MYKVVCLLTLALFWGSITTAQRVKRKGVDPIPLKQNPPAKSHTQPPTFSGKWQETLRKDKKGKVVAFTDTLYVHFLQHDSVAVRIGKSMTMKGLIQWEDPVIALAGDDYQVLKKSDTQCTLDDGDYIRVLEKRAYFDVEDVERTQINPKTAYQPVALNAQYFPGKWSVYRTQSTPGQLSHKAEPLRALSVDSVISAGKWKGTVTRVYQGKNQTNNVEFEQKGTELIMTGETFRQQFTVLVSSEKELIIEQQSVRYYFRKMN